MKIELPAEEIKNAISNIDLFTGKTTTNDILDQVFSTCVEIETSCTITSMI